MTDGSTQYPDHFVARLEILWGEGFLSPGGADEVHEIVRDLDLRGKTVLDVGCGTGGVDRVLRKVLHGLPLHLQDGRVGDRGFDCALTYGLLVSMECSGPEGSFARRVLI